MTKATEARENMQLEVCVYMVQLACDRIHLTLSHTSANAPLLSYSCWQSTGSASKSSGDLKIM